MVDVRGDVLRPPHGTTPAAVKSNKNQKWDPLRAMKTYFKYLGAIISNEGSQPEILSRIAQTTASLSRLKIIWRDKNISLASKVTLMRTLISSTFFYVCENCTLTAEIKRRTQTIEMRCFRRLLNISYKDHVTNEKVRNRIQNAVGVHDDLLTMLKKRKLRWYGHISRSSGMTILQGAMKGARRNGRQKKRWEDNIKEWTEMRFGGSLRAAKDREGWQGIFAMSSVVPRRPPRLRDERWERFPNALFYILNSLFLVKVDPGPWWGKNNGIVFWRSKNQVLSKHRIVVDNVMVLKIKRC